MKIDSTICYICCEREPVADSDDHVIPECFFTPAQQANLKLLKLRAHSSCHNRLPEAFIRNLFVGLSAGDRTSATAQLLWGDKAARGYLKDARMRREVLEGLIPREDVYSTGGIYLWSAPAIRFKRESVYPSLEKMVRGLYLHHTGTLLPRDAEFRWVEEHKLRFGRFPEYSQAATDGLAYDDVFECRYLVVREGDREGSLWWLTFYRATRFHCFAITSRDGTVEDHGP